jgi:rod shape determining protein RodA
MSVGYYGSDRTWRMSRERVLERWTAGHAPIRHVDVVLILAALSLTAIGVVVVYSATYHRLAWQDLPTTTFAVRQIVHAGVGIAAMIVLAVFDYRHLRTFAAAIYLLGLVLLGLVLTPLGATVSGAQRWIEVGAFQLQPAELAKVAVVIVLAALLHERKGDPGPLAVVVVLGLVAVPTALIVYQPDIGTAVVFPWIGFVLLLVAGTRARYLVGLALMAAGGLVAILRLELLEDYQLARLTAFLDPGNVELARTAAYNTNQSMIAIGSGGFAGKGFLEGTQTYLAYVPENHTDFIFTVVGEEFGFVGAAVVLSLFAVLLWRALRIAALSKDLFGTLVAVGAVAIITLQLFINVGMTIGIAPVTGIPLPFVSYGGTSLLAGYILVGLLLNVHMRRF